MTNKKTDKDGYDDHYKETSNITWSADSNSQEEYIERFKIQHLTPFAFDGRHLDGNVRGVAVERLFQHIKLLGKHPADITILDAGSGLGGLSVYLACHGYSVIGVEISKVACKQAETLASKFDVSDKCIILGESLEKTSILDLSIDLIIGLHTLHHFIKYDGVPKEFNRILKAGAKGFFADGFGENPIYRAFHNKKKMEKLGDVILNKRLIRKYFFNTFNISITPIDWFSMLNKMLIRVFGWKVRNIVHSFAKANYFIDRMIPINRTTLFLSGTIITTINKL